MNKALLTGKIKRLKQAGKEGAAASYITLMCKGRDSGYDFINVVAFGATSDYIHINLTEGDYIEVQGRLHYNSSTKQLEVIGNEIHCIAHGRTWQEVQ